MFRNYLWSEKQRTTKKWYYTKSFTISSGNFKVNQVAQSLHFRISQTLLISSTAFSQGIQGTCSLLSLCYYLVIGLIISLYHEVYIWERIFSLWWTIQNFAQFLCSCWPQQRKQLHQFFISQIKPLAGKQSGLRLRSSLIWL